MALLSKLVFLVGSVHQDPIPTVSSRSSMVGHNWLLCWYRLEACASVSPRATSRLQHLSREATRKAVETRKGTQPRIGHSLLPGGGTIEDRQGSDSQALHDHEIHSRRNSPALGHSLFLKLSSYEKRIHVRRVQPFLHHPTDLRPVSHCLPQSSRSSNLLRTNILFLGVCFGLKPPCACATTTIEHPTAFTPPPMYPTPPTSVPSLTLTLPSLSLPSLLGRLDSFFRLLPPRPVHRPPSPRLVRASERLQTTANVSNSPVFRPILDLDLALSQSPIHARPP